MHDVIVAGAGPVGLGLALGLTRAGVSVLVLESESGIAPESRAPLLLPRTLEILRQWDVLDAVRHRGRWQSTLELWAGTESKPRVTFDFSVVSDLTSLAGIVVLPQHRLQELLLEAVQPQAEVHFNRRVTRFRPHREGVEVQTAQGSFEARYLVGCDGAHSAVRQGLGWELEGKTYPAEVRLADVRVEQGETLPGPRLAEVERGVRFAVRLEGNLWRVISTLQKGESAGDPLPLAPLFGSGEVQTVWSQVFRIHCRTSPGFRAGRVMLAGDAAHINSPIGGMGLNAGMADAHNLAWKLAASLNGGDAEALLDSYDEERRQVVLNTLDPLTDGLTKLALTLPGSIRRLLEVVGAHALNTPAAQRAILRRWSMVETTYASRLIQGQGPWLGQRLDFPLEDGSRLLEATRGEPCLLLCDDGRLPSWGPIELPGVRTVRIRRAVDGHAPAALLRPDGYVGWMAMRPTRAELETGVTHALGRRAGFSAASPETRRPGL